MGSVLNAINAFIWIKKNKNANNKMVNYHIAKSQQIIKIVIYAKAIIFLMKKINVWVPNFVKKEIHQENA